MIVLALYSGRKKAYKRLLYCCKIYYDIFSRSFFNFWQRGYENLSIQVPNEKQLVEFPSIRHSNNALLTACIRYYFKPLILQRTAFLSSSKSVISPCIHDMTSCLLQLGFPAFPLEDIWSHDYNILAASTRGLKNLWKCAILAMVLASRWREC